MPHGYKRNRTQQSILCLLLVAHTAFRKLCIAGQTKRFRFLKWHSRTRWYALFSLNNYTAHAALYGANRITTNSLAIRLQHFGYPLAAVGVRFIAPAYMKTPTKWQTEMCVWWCGNVYLMMWKHVIDNVDMRVRWNGNTYLMTWIHVFDNARTRARWIGSLRLTECSLRYSNSFDTLL